MAKPQMKLGMFYWPGSGQHMAAWRHPLGAPDFDADINKVIELARLSERGLFDMFFMADAMTFWRGGLEAMSHDSGGAWIDPFTVMCTVAQHTRHLGLACTSTSTFDQPYLIARRFAGLDLVSGGRAAWNLVTSGNKREALNFSLQAHVEKSTRYRMAGEFAHVVRGLWNSWGDAAFIRDPDSGVFFDKDNLNILNHDGEFYKVEGPLNVPPSPQGEPVLIQAGASDDGRELAAATAEVVFGAQQTLAGAQEFYADVKGRMAAYGRDPDSLKIMPGLTCSVAVSREQAEAELEELQNLIDPVLGLALLSQRMDYDFSDHDPDDRVPDIPVKAQGESRTRLVNELLADNPGMTLRQLYKHFARARGHGQVVGTPRDVADRMEEWVTGNACDGFNIMPPLYPRDLERFVDLVVPELQRRGLYRTEYEATTLRGNLGLTRPAWSPGGVRKAGAAAG